MFKNNKIIQLFKGNINFETSFWIYLIFIPSILLSFLGFIVVYFINDTVLYVVFSLIFIYIAIAWIGTWRASKRFEGSVYWIYGFYAMSLFLMWNVVTFSLDQSDDNDEVAVQDTITNEKTDTSTTTPQESQPDDDCSIAIIPLHGELMTYIPPDAEDGAFFDYDSVSSEDITAKIEHANTISTIKAIIIEVDSGGGAPLAGEEISNTITKSTKPVVAVIRGSGNSSAYLAISDAHKIFASKFSDVGSIGVTMSYLSNANKNVRDGYVFEQLSAGKFKDAGNEDKQLTSEERALFMRDINIMHQHFIYEVAENRKWG